MVEQIFIQLALVLVVAFVFSYISKAFKQPLIIGYIVAGIVLSPFIIKLGASTDIIKTLSEFGVAFLLFIVGLHMNVKSIKEVGLNSLLIGLGQMILTFALGFAVSFWAIHLDATSSVYIAIAVSFSSTIIAMKLISDKGQIDSLYGKLSIGVLIVQDIAAMAVLMVISSTSSGRTIGSFALTSVLGGLSLVVILFLFGFTILPKITKNIARSQELLFLFSITWAFGIAALFGVIGFSVEIGALIAGVLLSVSPYGTEIGSKVRPLRDFFLVLFFIILGLNIQISNFSSILFPSLILSVVVLLFKPLVLMTLSALFGYTKRNNFLMGVTLGQVSEFSLVVLALGLSLGQVSQAIVSIITLTAIITITISSYLTIYSGPIYNALSGILSIFEKKKIKKERKLDKDYNVLLFGYNRTGFGILKALKEINAKSLVVDFNPDTISKLQKFRIPSVYGDAYDSEFLADLPLDKVRLVISTIPEVETNMLLIENVRFVNPKAIIIMRAHTIDQALEMYKKGANYVLIPHFLGGDYIANMIRDHKTNIDYYKGEKDNHIKLLKSILESDKAEAEKNPKNAKLVTSSDPKKI